MHKRQLGLCLVLVPAIACTLDQDLPVGEAVQLGGCHECGLNSPTMFGVPFHDVHPNQITRNDQGIRLVEVRNSNGHVVELHVQGDRLLGDPGAHPAPLLKDSTFHFDRLVDGELEETTLRIASIEWIESWFSSSGFVPSYKLSYVGDNSGTDDFCPRDGELGLGNPSEETVTSGHFLVFANERFNFETKTISKPGKGNNWINFACKKSAPYKMHLARHTLAGSTADYQSTWAERQALLKMYVADYCGDGGSHTVIGQPLVYLDAKGWFGEILGITDKGTLQFSDLISSLEAIWDENGAVCLKTPRLGGAIKCDGERKIPTCSSKQLSKWKSHGHLVSGNPKADVVFEDGELTLSD